MNSASEGRTLSPIAPFCGRKTWPQIWQVSFPEVVAAIALIKGTAAGLFRPGLEFVGKKDLAHTKSTGVVRMGLSEYSMVEKADGRVKKNGLRRSGSLLSSRCD